MSKATKAKMAIALNVLLKGQVGLLVLSALLLLAPLLWQIDASHAVMHGQHLLPAQTLPAQAMDTGPWGGGDAQVV